MATPSLVLGSSSPYRAELLTRLGIPFTQESPDIDEASFDDRFDEMSAKDFALLLAREKAGALANSGGERWILCADQVGVLDDRGARTLLRKPGGYQKCVDQLMMLSGKTHQLFNGIVLLSEASGAIEESVDVQQLLMREFTVEEAENYVANYAPLDCAGGYRIEDAGISLFERIRSEDYTGIIGLPLLNVSRMLREVGLLPHSG